MKKRKKAISIFMHVEFLGIKFFLIIVMISFQKERKIFLNDYPYIKINTAKYYLNQKLTT